MTNGKGKQKSGGIEYKSLSHVALEEKVTEDIARVSSLTALEVSLSTLSFSSQ